MRSGTLADASPCVKGEGLAGLPARREMGQREGGEEARKEEGWDVTKFLGISARREVETARVLRPPDNSRPRSSQCDDGSEVRLSCKKFSFSNGNKKVLFSIGCSEAISKE